MKKSYIIPLIVGLIFAIPSITSAAPGIPHQFYGTITFTNGDAPDGFTVKANIDGEEIGSGTTSDGTYGYNTNIFFATDPDGTNADETIEFSVGGIEAEEGEVFENGGWTELNLTIHGTFGTLSESDEDEGITSSSIAVSEDQSAIIELGENIDITISATSTTSATITEVSKLTDNQSPPAGTIKLAGYEINITGTDITISVAMTHNDTGIEEGTIKPYMYNGSSWVEISPFTINTNTNTVTFEINSAETPYALFGEPIPSTSEVVVIVAGPGGGGGGGGGGVGVGPRPTPSTAGDATGDNQVNIFDFNTLMVNWGSGGGATSADLDRNGTVNIFDFNILMVNWSQ